jgi:LPXTG-motif cell wall-anchored protein
MHRWPSRLLVVIAVVSGWVLAAQPTRADSTVPIQPGTVPVSAAAFAQTDQANRPSACDIGGGPFADADVWTFTTKPDRRDLMAVTVTFIAPGRAERQTRTIESGDAGRDRDPGASDHSEGDRHAGGDHQAVDGIDRGVAWVRTPAGRTLVAASARVAGDASVELVLGGTCPAVRAMEQATVASAKTVDGSTTTSKGATTRVLGTGTPTPTGMPRAAEPYSQTGRSHASLPSTGLDIVGMVTLGSTLVVAGTLLLIVRRRREPRASAVPAVEPLVWVRSEPGA